ncbi:hypothetical protein BSPWISOX_1550 [uncultured Gammaproteobacteria bacterium]|jgi:uncharacterized protein YydD (DUF2326 family)|nr:hypothetical protein BSPWISOX_1550 [uncultured Gammaproteobacteria bacterium]
MFLKKLLINNGSKIIREIRFHHGVNLIVDETHTSNQQETGNNIGKTTLLRLIDFCLASDGKNIYKDPEFKNKQNSKIEKFLTDNDIVITLVLTENLSDDSARKIIIKRNFLARKNKLLEINGEQYNNTEFPRKLKQLIFHSNYSKPSFRQIISKNIRDEKNKLTNTLKTLHQATTNDSYESVYLFWLGIELADIDEKHQLLADKKTEKNLQTRFLKEQKLSQIEQALVVIERDIKEYTTKKDSLNINDDFKQDLEKLNLIKGNLNQLSTRVSQLEMRKSLILESKEDLNQEITVVDNERIAHLYKKAKSLIPDLQKSFEDIVDFHNKIVKEKIKYIIKELPELDHELKELQNKISALLTDEKIYSDKVKKSNTIDDLQLIITRLNELHEQKGSFEEKRRMFQDSVAKLKNISTKLEKINNNISEKDTLIEEQIKDFNRYFTKISEKLYAEKFILSSNKTDKGYLLDVSSITGNLGTGKKKGQIAAFDLAYIQFADKNQIKAPHFILHDQIENIHSNQILQLINIVASINCQYIVPVLQDKLPENIDIEKYKILSLSQQDKLFKVVG